MLVVTGWLAIVSTLGEAAEPTDYVGRFVASQQDVDQATSAAVEAGAKQFSALIRPIARRRLADSMRGTTWLEFVVAGSQITIKSERNPVGWATAWDGVPIPVTVDDGKTVQLRRWMESGDLRVELCDDEGGCLDYTFELSAEAVVMRRRTRSPQLSEPVSFTIRYARQ